MMSRISPLFALLAIGSVIGVPGTNEKEIQPILGGQFARYNEFTGAVSLKVPGMSHHMCGGAVIGTRHVLTAGHCVDIEGAYNIIVRGGIQNLRDEFYAIRRSVVKIFLHPYYISEILGIRRSRNDIAILVVNQDLVQGHIVEALLLPTSPPSMDFQYTLAGWGLSSPTTVQYRLKTLHMTLGDDYMCRFHVPHTLCAYSNNGASCPGDSGSPLVRGDRVYGILSTGKCIYGSLSGLVDVYYYVNWINTIIRENPY